MTFEIPCTCGRSLSVTAGQAGTAVICSCGRRHRVPASQEARGETQHARDSDDAPLPAEFTLLLTAELDARQRVNDESFAHYVAALHQEVRTWLEEEPPPCGSHVQIGCALLPSDRSVVEIQVHADEGQEAFHALHRRISDLAVPPVRGIVIFVVRMLVGGQREPLPNWEFNLPFASYLEGHHSLEAALLAAFGEAADEPAAITPPSVRLPRRWSVPSWWERLRKLLFRRLDPEPAEADQAEDDESAGPFDRRAAAESALDNLSLAQLTALVEQSPELAWAYRRRAELYRSAEEWEAAIADYSHYLEHYPEDAVALAARGEALCRAQRMQPGLADFTASLRLDPNQVRAFWDRALVYCELGAWEAAAADCSSALAIDAHRPSLYVLRARTHLARAEPHAALADLTQCLTIDPHHEEAYFLRALVRRNLATGTAQSDETYTDLLADLNALLRINPRHAQGYSHRAEVHLNQQQFDEAVADCDAALHWDADCAAALGVRAVAYRALGKMDRALADCEEAIRRDLESSEVYLTRAMAYHAQGEYELALTDCAAALALTPDHAGVYEFRGVLQLERDNTEQAVADFTQGLQYAPSSSRLYVHRGNAYRVQGRLPEAIEDYTQGLELNPNDVGGYLNRALSWQDLENFERAREDLDTAIARFPELPAAYDLRARLWVREEAWDKALSDWTKSLELDVEFAPAYYSRGHLYLQLGQYDDAMRDFDELLRLCPTLPAAYLGRGSAWICKDEKEHAERDFGEAMQLEPESASRYQLQRLLVEASHHHRRERFRDAVLRASEALELDPASEAARQIRAAAYWYSDQLVEAADDYSQLLDAFGPSLGVLNGRGHVLAELGEFELGLADLERAVEMAEQQATTTGLAYALNGRALALAGLERYDEAERDFARSLAAAPHNAWAHYNRGRMLKQRGQVAEAAEAFRQALECSDPPLTARKRSRAEAFLSGH